MKRSMTMAQALIVLSILISTVAAQSDPVVEPTGMLTLAPVFDRTCVAVQVPLTSTQALAGVRWFNNDDQTVFPHILVAGGLTDVPPAYRDAVEVALDVGGAESGWSEISFSEPVVSATGSLYVIFQLPANEEGVEPGVGPGFGHKEADSQSCVFLSADGDEWVRLETHYQLLVDPVYTLRVPGMMAVTCSFGNPGVEVALMEDALPVIERTELLRPYPNPFNPTTKIAFTLKNPGHVRLAIYDLRGRWIKNLKNESLETGRYEIPWSGQDHHDRHVASGVYFARLQADGKTETQRLLLVK